MTSTHILVSNLAVKDIEELNISLPNKQIYIYIYITEKPFTSKWQKEM